MTDGRLLTPSCLDAETLAAFVDGTLEAGERARIERHLVECETCYEALAETLLTVRDLNAHEPVRTAATVPARARNWRVPAAFAGLLTAAAALWLLVAPRTARSPLSPNDRPELASLVSAIGGERVTEGRLTGGFKWGPPPTAMRGGPERTLSAEARLAAARLAEATRSNPSPAARAAQATAQLFLGHADEAIAALEQSVADKPDWAPPWSDLAAALLARHAIGNRPDDLTQALRATDRAMAIQPSPEPAFNRAVVLERLGRDQMALDAWDQYLRLDPSTEWAVEARSRRVAIERRAGR